MKKNKKILKLFILFLFLITLSGCTNTLKNSEGKVITNTETGQSITDNILCKPTEENLLKIYEENNKDLSNLPNCDNMPVIGNYEGLWTNIFVRPLAYAIIKIGTFVHSNILAIIIITILIRLILFPITKKTAMQSELMKEAQPEIARIEKKYEGKTDEASINKKNQETLIVYQKYKINPISSCLFSFIQLPLLFAFLEAIQRTPAIFEETIFKGTFLSLEMGKTTWTAITQGQYQYIVITLIIIATTYFSFKLNGTGNSGNDAMAKQQKTMMIFMVVFISFMSFTLPTAVGIYWIFSSGFTIFQNVLTDRRKKNEKN